MQNLFNLLIILFIMIVPDILTHIKQFSLNSSSVRSDLRVLTVEGSPRGDLLFMAILEDRSVSQEGSFVVDDRASA